MKENINDSYCAEISRDWDFAQVFGCINNKHECVAYYSSYITTYLYSYKKLIYLYDNFQKHFYFFCLENEFETILDFSSIYTIINKWNHMLFKSFFLIIFKENFYAFTYFKKIKQTDYRNNAQATTKSWNWKSVGELVKLHCIFRFSITIWFSKKKLGVLDFISIAS